MTQPEKSTTPAQPSYVQLRGISKAFGAEQALDRVDISFLDGEIHGLVGENGSGKSTLIKVLAGFHTPDEGEIIVRGTPVSLPMKPGGYRELGFAFVHQDLGLIPSLSVMENIRIERIAASRGAARISWRQAEQITRGLFERFGAPWIPPRAMVADLRPIDRALVAITRALSQLDGEGIAGQVPGRLLVLDEPTAFLSRAEADQLFATLREIAVSGTAVLFVSHKLREVLDFTYLITALRDGRIAGTRLTADATEQDIASMVLGHDPAVQAREQAAPIQPSAGKPLLSLHGLRVAGRLNGIDLDIPGGEILGLTGLEGSGFEEILYALFGLSAYRVSGSLELAGTTSDLSRFTPEEAMREAIALVPGDRLAQGCVTSLSIRENLAAPVLETFWSGGHLSWRQINQAARRLADQFDIRPREVSRDVSTLSGGNQQKVLLAKWLQTGPRVLLLHEPTQGVDIGARQQIFDFIKAEIREDKCLLIASTDYEQLEQLCTRVLVIGEQQVKADLRGRDIDRNRIAEECLLSQRAIASNREA